MNLFNRKNNDINFVDIKKDRSKELENQSLATIGFISSAINDIEETNKSIQDEIIDVVSTIHSLTEIKANLDKTCEENNAIVKNLKNIINVKTDDEVTE